MNINFLVCETSLVAVELGKAHGSYWTLENDDARRAFHQFLTRYPGPFRVLNDGGDDLDKFKLIRFHELEQAGVLYAKSDLGGPDDNAICDQADVIMKLLPTEE